jgi:hypothetical protein
MIALGLSTQFPVQLRRCNQRGAVFSASKRSKMGCNAKLNRETPMNNGNLQLSPARTSTDGSVTADELSRAKRELLQAEVRLAKARASAAAAEVDIKVIGTRLKALAR